MQKRWLIKELPAEKEITSLMEALQLERTLATILIQRGIKDFDEARAFFRPSLEDLHDPFTMKNLPEAVKRLQEAFSNQEKILLFGDYDVDGTTAVAVLYNVMKPHFSNLDYYIPDRYAEGYGLSIQGIDYAVENNVNVLITLDCGIKAIDKIAYAREKGLDVIVCDHHEPGEEVPNCLVLDPKQKECMYPYKELSGCGVGFKLMQGLYLSQGWNQDILWEQLDLLAISIGADIVPVTGENRIFCYNGLKQINSKPRKGISEILKTAQKDLPLSLTHVVFIIAPRINAAGRIHSGKKAVELMISDDIETLNELANEIHQDNEYRKELDKQITEEAFEQIAQDPMAEQNMSTVVFKEDWHKGVIGIVASRLIEKIYKPTIVLTLSNGKLTGSARSISGLDIHEALQGCEDILEQFGGHYFAAGMTLLPENLELFKNRFEEQVKRLLKKEDTVPLQKVDYDLHFDELYLPTEKVTQEPKIRRILAQLEPHGPGNMKPVFCSKNVFVVQHRILKDVHLKLSLKQPNCKHVIEAIAFNMIDKLPLIESGFPIDILYTLETNEFRDMKTLQLNIKDIRSTV